MQRSANRRALGLLATVAVLAVGTVAGSAWAHVARAARLNTSSYFRGPGGNVVCGYFSGSGVTPLLECGVPAGLKPPPPRPTASDCHDLDFASNRVRLRASGRIVGFCSGDVGVLAELKTAPVLAYGTSFHRGAITCSSSVAWLKCVNGSGHGFSLSRLRWRHT
jgi:hypothetical protein